MQGMGWCCLEELVWGDAAHPWVAPGVLHTRGPGAARASLLCNGPAKAVGMHFFSFSLQGVADRPGFSVAMACMRQCLRQDGFHPSSMCCPAGTYKIPTVNDIPLDLRVTLLRDAPCAQTPLVHSSKAVGEPPLFLGASVFFALKARRCCATVWRRTRASCSAARAFAGMLTSQGLSVSGAARRAVRPLASPLPQCRALLQCLYLMSTCHAMQCALLHSLGRT